MALDLARIAHYADGAGRMLDTPQRRSLLFVDGVVGGEGEGPLAPLPVRSRVVLFSDNVALGDGAACRLMGFNPRRVPIVREALGVQEYPLVAGSVGPTTVVYNGEERALESLGRLSRPPFRPPRGWKRALTSDRSGSTA